MFRISYIDENNTIQHKQFDDTKQAQIWVDSTPQITPLRLLVWDELIECFSTLREF